MATLVLSAVGTAIAGPFGGMLGAIAGRTLDSQVFGIGNRRVEGPRRDDLTVQSAAFGRPIPLVYGAGRYAGNVLWSTGLVEKREEESQGGKGGPSVTNVTYSYSASFAVGLCAGPISSIGRIWSDGKLIRDVSGDLAVGGSVRQYLGDEDQLPDTLIEGALGVGTAPAFRGIAYCVFESLELAEFGNRIPNLTFEINTGAAPEIIEIAADLLARAGVKTQGEGASQSVSGFSVSGGQSLRDGLNDLLEVFQLSMTTQADTVRLSTGADQPVAAFSVDDLGIADPSGDGGQLMVDFDHAADLPSEVGLGYSDPANDYQAGLQRAQTAGLAPGVSRVRVNSSFVLPAVQARALAGQMLSRARQHSAAVQFRIGMPGALLEPGDVVSMSEGLPKPTLFQIDQIVEEGFTRSVTATSLPLISAAALSEMPASSGAVFYPQSSGKPAIDFDVFELPATRQFGDEPKLFASVARLGGQVRSAGLYVSDDGGLDYRLVSSVPVSGIRGACVNGLEDRNPALVDRAGVLEVALAHADMALASRPWLAILNGANLAMVGPELIQFETATLTESGTYQLSGLLRGRGGTEMSLMGQTPGQRFILLQSGDLASRSFGVGDIGSNIDFKIVPPSQNLAQAPARNAALTGRALLPLSPVHLSARYTAAAGVSAAWVRRSRSGYAWLDGADAPLGEASEAYRITYTSGALSLVRDVSQTSDQLDSAGLASAFGSGPYDLNISVVQLSDTVGAGRAAVLTLSIPA
ncbi:MAG: phage tail protein [Pseudomonadota bacterium]